MPTCLGEEEIAALADLPGARIERIVSTGQASPPGFWYDQDHAEWVVLLSGSAGLWIEDEDAPRILRPGSYVEIPAHARHRVRMDGYRPAHRLARRAFGPDQRFRNQKTRLRTTLTISEVASGK